MEKKESIDIVEFLKARSHEIQAIEKSIAVSHKQSLAWQRLPHYKRRRSRNFDKRMSRKFTHRPKDRHALRTHTYYAKRAFMLKLPNFSIPWRRRLKSMKYIYKSQHRGFIFDESFRGVRVYLKTDVLGFARGEYGGGGVGTRGRLAGVDFGKERVIQYISNEFEVIIENEEVVVIGLELPLSQIARMDCSISVMLRGDLAFKNSHTYQIYRADDGRGNLETCKIICKRSEIMELFQLLVNASLIPVCLEEIHRLALENNTVSVYDKVASPIYRLIENKMVADVVGKYSRTPPAKRVNCDLSRLYLQNENVGRYFIFAMPKGTADPAAEIFSGSTCVGRVIRGGYRFSSARFCGLAFCYDNIAQPLDALQCKGLAQRSLYPIEVVRWI